MKTKATNSILVSIIIPVYNSEKTFDKCINSVLEQSYDNLEIIVVNDGSTGNISEMIKNYIDPRIIYCVHEHNRGLFRARLTGFESATGEYICTLDSDDFISVDFVQVLLEEMLKGSADMIASNFVMDFDDGRRMVDNLAMFHHAVYEKEDVIRTFFAQEGRNHYWHVVWNKLYHRKIWEKAYEYLSEIQDHIIMGEDILYSSIFYFYSRKLVTTDYTGHFYFQHTGASTNLSGNAKKFKKSISDLHKVFYYVEKFLEMQQIPQATLLRFWDWKTLYSKFWLGNIQNSGLSIREKKELKDYLKSKFALKELHFATERDSYFYSVKTYWDARLEKVKKEIISEDVTHVSFDVFDTLLLRPFLEPSDLFYLMDDYFQKQYEAYTSLDYYSIRLNAEKHLRELLKVGFLQDITLDEIYEQIKKEYDFPQDMIADMKAYEMKLEYELIKERTTVRRLYELAVRKGKVIVCISDMYLPKEFILKLLEKFEIYPDYLYVSSEIKLTKAWGDMYSYVLKDLNLNGKSIIHIGDNWESDYIKPGKYGMHSVFMPKPAHVIWGTMGDIPGGGAIKNLKSYKGNLMNHDKIFDSFVIRSMYGVIANCLFDNPYASFSQYSDYNASPYFIGYAALGMHMLGLVKMMLDDMTKKGIETIVFLARDGYLPKKTYDLVKAAYLNAPKSKYLFVSRKSLLPLLISDKNSLYNLTEWFDYRNYSINDFVNLLKPVLNEWSAEKRNIFIEKGFSIDKKIQSIREYHRITELIYEELLNQDKLKEYKGQVNLYFGSYFKGSSALFDIGYSARGQAILNSFLNQTIYGYYIHSNSSDSCRNAKKAGCKYMDYYNFTPSITGTIREMLISDLSGSCLSYETVAGEMEPKIEPVSYDYLTHFAVETVQKGALDFVQSYLETFGKYLRGMDFRYQDASATFENFLAYPKEIEKKIFSFIDFEDDIYLGHNENLVYAWNKALKYHALGDKVISGPEAFNIINIHQRWKRIVYFILFDRAELKKKVNRNLQSKPLILHGLKKVYGVMKRIKHRK